LKLVRRSRILIWLVSLGRESRLSAKMFRPFRPFNIVAVLLVASIAQAQYDPPAGYYTTATGTGATLKAQLNAIIDQHTVISYSNRAAPLKDLDKDAVNPSNVLLIYSGYTVAASQFPSGTANTEHLWVQTYGIDNDATAYGDLFNLRPSDVDVNSARADKYYDNGGTLPADPEAPLCRADSDSWEPRDADKGDIARAMFYMDTRYEGDSNDGLTRNLVLTDNTALITTSNNYMGKLSALIEWNYLYPVSTEEKARNHKIFTTYQHNRNPYVDHPEYVWAVFG
jgi:endonuclease I